jgi:hypothetical protein
MTLPAFAAVSDLEVRLGLEPGSLENEDLARAQAALDDASTLVRAEAGKSWVDEDNNSVAPAPVVAISIRAALRAFRNPDGVGSESLGGLYTYSYAKGEASIYLTEDEVAIVKKAALGDFGRLPMGTIRTASNYYDPVLEDEINKYIWWD